MTYNVEVDSKLFLLQQVYVKKCYIESISTIKKIPIYCLKETCELFIKNEAMLKIK